MTQLKVSILISIPIGLLLVSACRSTARRSDTSETSANTIISSTPPFQTKEPERYQAVRSITISRAGGESVVTKTLIAKDGNMRRDEYETETKEKIAYLDLPGGQFILLPKASLYADLNSERGDELDSSVRQDDTENSPERLLNAAPVAARYEKIGSEVISSRNTSKYRVLVNTSARGTVTNSETLIWIDEVLGMPVKSETVAATGDRTTMELSGIQLEVDKSLFQIPAGYKKVASRAIRERLRAPD